MNQFEKGFQQSPEKPEEIKKDIVLMTGFIREKIDEFNIHPDDVNYCVLTAIQEELKIESVKLMEIIGKALDKAISNKRKSIVDKTTNDRNWE